jgi:hypothetical protein
MTYEQLNTCSNSHLVLSSTTMRVFSAKLTMEVNKKKKVHILRC